MLQSMGSQRAEHNLVPEQQKRCSRGMEKMVTLRVL